MCNTEHQSLSQLVPTQEEIQCWDITSYIPLILIKENTSHSNSNKSSDAMKKHLKELCMEISNSNDVEFV